MMKNTFMANAQNVNKEWLVIDATDQTVGRLSAEVAKLLRGKHKPTFTPHVDCGDNVIIINAEKVKFTGKKLDDKVYYRHSNHPGGLKSITAGKLLERKPERVLELAIKGMLPKNKLGSKMYRNLHVCVGSSHKYEAQKPKVYELKG